MLRQTLESYGVDTAYLKETETLQGNAVIQVDRSGQNCILLYGGSNRRLTEAQISETIARFSPGDWLILQPLAGVGRCRLCQGNAGGAQPFPL